MSNLMHPRCISFPPTLPAKIDGYTHMRAEKAKKLGIKMKWNRSKAVRALILLGLEKVKDDSSRTN